MDDLLCRLCGRMAPHSDYMEKHHLTPKSKGGKNTASVCVDCAVQVHLLFTNNELRDSLNTIALLRAHPRVQKWIAWVRKRKGFGVCHKIKKKRR